MLRVSSHQKFLAFAIMAAAVPCITLTLGGCGTDKTNDIAPSVSPASQQQGTDPSKRDPISNGAPSDIDGVWNSECLMNPATHRSRPRLDRSISIRQEYRLGNYVITHKSYSDDQCQRPIYSMTWIGKFNTSGKFPKQDNRTLMSLYLKEIRVEFHDYQVALQANRERLCGISNWPVTDPKLNEGRFTQRTDFAITGLDCGQMSDFLSPLKLANPQGTAIDSVDTLYTLVYKVENERLRTGTTLVYRRGFQDPQAKGTRPEDRSFDLESHEGGLKKLP